ncbi:terminase small subunit [Mesorhizobium australicum]|uniref:terminase small subunit n=1 Tax=Mesorhizobium australicum TaxID=536018 RepID=UPI00333D90D6
MSKKNLPATVPAAPPDLDPGELAELEAVLAQAALPLDLAPDLAAEDAAALEKALSPLRPKHQAWVRYYIISKNGADAARRAGYVGKEGVKAAAHRILHRPDVQAALAAFTAALAKRTVFDFDAASKKILEASEFAFKTNNATAAVRSAELLAKLHGHLNDKLQVQHRGDVAFIFPDRHGVKSNG